MWRYLWSSYVLQDFLVAMLNNSHKDYLKIEILQQKGIVTWHYFQ